MIKINLVAETPAAASIQAERPQFSLGAKQGDIILLIVIALALVVALTGTALALALAALFDFGPGVAAGMLAGALTSTPTLAAAQDAIGEVVLPRGFSQARVASNITTSYAITYVFGMAGLILMMRLLPRIVRIDLPLTRLPPSLDGLTIAQISDLHAGYFTGAAKIRGFVAATNALRPDIIAITGDMFHQTSESAQICADELSALYAPLGIYAIMGNHERRLPPAQGEVPFHRAGIDLLCNAAHRIAVNGSALWMLGLDDLIRHRGNLASTLDGVPDEACKILLVHEPDFAEWSAHTRRAAEKPKPRKKTRPTRASKQRRLDDKRHRGETKRRRGPVAED